MAVVLTAQRRTSPEAWKKKTWKVNTTPGGLTCCNTRYLGYIYLNLTAVASCSGVAFVLSIRTVCCPITQLIQWDAQARGRTGPLSWVTLSHHIICTLNQLVITCASLDPSSYINHNTLGSWDSH